MSYIKFCSLTLEQKQLIETPSKTAEELCELIGCGVATISRWRKKLGVDISRGSKKGKPKPWQANKVQKLCVQCGGNYSIVASKALTSKYCSRKCMYDNVDYIDSLKAADKAYMRTPEYSKAKSKEDTPEYRKYRNRVATLTRRAYEQNKDIINPNGYVRAIAGVEGGYHLDHVVSCREGFERGMTPEQVSCVSNLQMLPWRTNIIKGRKSDHIPYPQVEEHTKHG